MKAIDAAYIAAYLDAVGTIKIMPPNQGDISCLYVWITRPDFKLMEYLQRFGAYVVDMKDGQFRAKWKDHSAYHLLKAIRYFSKEKKEQIDLGIEFYETKISEQKEEKFDIPYRVRLKLLKQTED